MAHIGDEAWKDQAVINVRDMVMQYRNHTSIILWGVRINESQDDDDFYRRTNAAAHELDPSRPTGRCAGSTKRAVFWKTSTLTMILCMTARTRDAEKRRR